MNDLTTILMMLSKSNESFSKRSLHNDSGFVITLKPLIYLACPYNHPDKDIRHQRFIAVNKAAGKLMKEGYVVFSPISHTHPIAVECELPKGWEYWENFDRAYLSCSHKLIVLCIDGWKESIGVTAEIKIASEMGIPIEFINE